MTAPQARVHAPEFPQGLTWLNTPRPLTLRELRGKIVLLEFWTSGCINCHHNIPQLHRLEARFPDELVVISVHSAKFTSEQLTANIRETALRLGIDHPIVSDVGLRVWEEYTARGWPTVVVVDALGMVVHTQSGEFLAEELTPLIEQLINEAEGQGKLDRRALDVRPELLSEPARLLSYPGKLLVAPDEHGKPTRLYIADTGHNRIIELRLTADSLSAEVTRVFGSGAAALQDGAATEAAFHNPHGLALDGATLYVADTDNHAVRAIDLHAGTVRTVAGTGEKAHGRFNVDAPTATPLRSPWGLLAIDDVLFIAMAGSHQIWALLEETRLGPFAGNGYEALSDGPRAEASFNQPSDLALGLDYMFVADSEASAIRAISLDPQSEVSTLIGEGLFVWGDVDGTAEEVRLQHPVGLTYADRFIYIADTYNNKIKRLDAGNGRVTTLIGNGTTGHVDGSFEEAELFGPEGVVIANRKLYIADTNNHLIRVADLATRTIHTLRLTGLERLATIAPRALPTTTLPPITVGSGPASFLFDIVLPAGYKLNPDAPLTLREVDGGSLHTFMGDEQPMLNATLDADIDAILDLTIYYCATGDEALCLIHDARVVLPIHVAADGPTLVRVAYTIQP